MSWLFLFLAGLLEVVWAAALPRAHEPRWLAVLVVGLLGSMVFLALAVREIPLGTAYAVWVGIGIVGTTIVSVAAFGQRLSPLQWVFLALASIGIIGMKLAAPPPADPADTAAR